MLKYKDFEGAHEFDGGWLCGEVTNTEAVITFMGRTVPELEAAFEDSVDDYLAMCAEEGITPEKPR